jgi:hypothetical protein
VNLVEYLLFTRSAVLSPSRGRSRGLGAAGRPSLTLSLDRGSAATPDGSGPLICFGALIFGFTVRFLRSDIPLLFSSPLEEFMPMVGVMELSRGVVVLHLGRDSEWNQIQWMRFGARTTTPNRTSKVVTYCETVDQKYRQDLLTLLLQSETSRADSVIYKILAALLGKSIILFPIPLSTYRPFAVEMPITHFIQLKCQ